MYTFVANFLGYAIIKNYLNWVIFNQVFTKVKRVTFFFETQCTCLDHVTELQLSY